MLEKPYIQDQKIKDCLKEQYGINAVNLEFLPIGADVNTAVYRVTTESKTQFYLKLRSEDIDEETVTIPKLLHDNGIKQIIVPISTKNQKLWANLDSYILTLYPFIEGKDGFEVTLTNPQWIELGTVLKRIHMTKVPSELKESLPKESYSAKWRESVKTLLKRIETETFNEPTAIKLADLMKSKKEEIELIVERAEKLGSELQNQNLEFVLCHGDIHAGNILIDKNGAIYIVDWDTLILAPKEKDLMFTGGGIGSVWNKPKESELFYQGYGSVDINPTALAYYRYERIVQDIAAFCEEIFLTHKSGPDREKSLEYFTNQFQPNNVVEIAMKQ